MIVIDGFTIDAAIKQKHDRENEATEYPVEKGSKATDHLQAKPREYEVEGVVSDTPIGSMVGVREREATASTASAASAFLEGVRGRSLRPTEAARAKLELIWDNLQPITIVTETKTYRDMLPLKLSIPESKETGNSFEFTATFRQLITVVNDRVVVRAAIPAGPRQNLGDLSKDNPLLSAVRCIDRDKKTGVCKQSEILKRGADGKWHHPDGSLLTKEEMNQWGQDQTLTREHGAAFDPASGVWVDKETKQPISKYPDRAYWDKDRTLIKQGKTTDNFWDDVERQHDRPEGPAE